jgi:hypothetical protein
MGESGSAGALSLKLALQWNITKYKLDDSISRHVEQANAEL